MGKEAKAAYPRWHMAAFAATILALLIVGSCFFRDQYILQKEAVESHLRSIATLKARQIENWRAEKIASAAVLMERIHLITSVERFLASGDPQEAAEIMRQFHTLRTFHHYADILLVDMDMKPRLSLRPGHLKGHTKYVSSIRDAFAEQAPVWTSIVVEPDYTDPHLSVVVPLFIDTDKEKAVGALVMISNAAQYLYPIIQSWPTASATAETLLVRRSGEEVLFLNELRHTKDTALKLRIPLNQADLPAAMAVSGREGFVMGRDYRGVEVASVIMAIRQSPWFMVAKVDRAEAFSEWRARSLLMIFLMSAAVGLVVVLAFFFRQRYQKVWYRKLYQTETALSRALERHSITLKSIGDAVIASDPDGRVELMNPVAEKLTGWRLEEAAGKEVKEVFKIISEGTREEVEDPVMRVLASGRVQGVANHTLLISKQGDEIPIADSCAPIKNRKGESIGVVLVFNDQTNERKQQSALAESEQKFRLLSENSLDVIWTMNFDLEFTYVNPAVETMTGHTPEEWIGSHLPEHCDEGHFSKMTQIIAEEMARGSEARGVVFETVMLKKSGDPIPVEIRGKIICDESGQPISLQGATRDITDRKRAEETQKELQEQLHQAQKMESVGRLAGGVAHDYNNILSVIIGYTELSLDDVTPGELLYDNLQEVLKAAFRSRDMTRQLLAFARRETVAPKVLNLNHTLEGMLKMIRRLIGENIQLVWLPGELLWPVAMDPSQIDQILANLCVNARDAISELGTISIETGIITIDEAYCEHHRGFIPGDFVTLSVSDNGSGMDKETLDMIFEPFFTTKALGAGTGLGLSTVYGIAKQNNGFVNVYSELGKGTTVRIYFPRHVGAIEDEHQQANGQTLKGRGETILVVEDEASILRLTGIILRRLGYHVLPANSPEEALGIAKAHDGNISLLITDVIMPEMNGRELTERLQSIFPTMKYLFMSGYTADVIARSGVLERGVHFIQKPFAQNDLAVKIREVLDS